MSGTKPPALNGLRERPEAIAASLNAALKRNNLRDVAKALKVVMQAHNVKALSENTGMRRDSLYKTFNGKTDPRFGRILKLLDGLDVRLVVKAVPPKAKPPRPRMGRPRLRER